MDRYIEFASNHYLLVFALVCVVFLLIQDLVANALNKFESVSPLIAVTKMNHDDILILDVRDATEFLKSHIDNAVNIPLDKLQDKLVSFEKYKNQSVVVVCQTGARSISACKTLNNAGFSQIFNITGGMQSWEENKLPIKNSSKLKD